MRLLTRLALLAVSSLLLAAPVLVAEDSAAAKPVKSSPQLTGEMAKLAGFLGTWEINSTWAGGTSLWARSEFEVGLGGKFLFARTLAKDGDGEPYERYNTYFAHGEDGWISYGFTHDGTVAIVDQIEIGEKAGKAFITSVWQQGGQDIKQTVQLATSDSYGWLVWSRPAGSDGEWAQIMEGTWKRVD